MRRTDEKRTGGRGRVVHWGRFDQIMGEGLLWLSTIVGVALTVVVVVRVFLRDRLRVSVEVDGFSSTVLPGRTAGRFSLRPDEHAVLVVTDPTTADRVADVAPLVVLFTAAALISWLLLRVLVTLRTGDPFSRQNLHRVQALAATLFLSAYAWAFVGWLGRSHFAAAAQDVLGSGATIQRWLSVPVWPLLTALTLGAVTEFLRRGAELRDDADGLV